MTLAITNELLSRHIKKHYESTVDFHIFNFGLEWIVQAKEMLMRLDSKEYERTSANLIIILKPDNVELILMSPYTFTSPIMEYLIEAGASVQGMHHRWNEAYFFLNRSESNETILSKIDDLINACTWSYYESLQNNVQRLYDEVEFVKPVTERKEKEIAKFTSRIIEDIKERLVVLKEEQVKTNNCFKYREYRKRYFNSSNLVEKIFGFRLDNKIENRLIRLWYLTDDPILEDIFCSKNYEGVNAGYIAYCLCNIQRQSFLQYHECKHIVSAERLVLRHMYRYMSSSCSMKPFEEKLNYMLERLMEP